MQSLRRHRLSRVGVRVALAAAGLVACGGDDTGTTAVPSAGAVAGEETSDGAGFGETNWRADDLPGLGAVFGTQRATYEYYIPEGASDRLAAGEPLDIVPGRFSAVVGDSVKIVNDDRRGHNVGPWYVGPNETLIQKFTSPGVYEGLCTVHPSGALILEVSEA